MTDRGAECAEAAAVRVAPILDWGERRVADEVAAYRARWPPSVGPNGRPTTSTPTRNRWPRPTSGRARWAELWTDKLAA